MKKITFLIFMFFSPFIITGIITGCALSDADRARGDSRSVWDDTRSSRSTDRAGDDSRDTVDASTPVETNTGPSSDSAPASVAPGPIDPEPSPAPPSPSEESIAPAPSGSAEPIRVVTCSSSTTKPNEVTYRLYGPGVTNPEYVCELDVSTTLRQDDWRARLSNSRNYCAEELERRVEDRESTGYTCQ